MATIVTRAGKGSSLTWVEGDANFTNLNNDKIEAVSDDLTPSLGGNLDVAGNSIVSSANGDVTIAPDGTGITILQSDVEVGYGTARAAITSNGAYALDLVTNGGLNSGSITINPNANADIEISPNGTGNVVISGLSYPNADGTAGQVIVTDGAGNLSWDNASSFDPASPGAIGGTTPNTGTFTTLTLNATGEMRFADSDSSNYVGFKAPATVTANKVWTLPATDGTAGQVLSTNGSGVLSWATDATGGGTSASYAIITVSGFKTSFVSGTIYSGTISETYDSNNIVTVSTPQFTLGAGTYILQGIGTVQSNNGTETGVVLYNITDSTTLFTGAKTSGGSSTRFINPYSWVINLTITGSKTYEVRYDIGDINAVMTAINTRIHITKIA